APIYFCPVRIGGREYIDAGIGRFACFDLATKKAADFMLIIHPSPPSGIASVRIPAHNGASPNGRHRGFLSIAELASRINLDARFSLALDLNQHRHPEKFFVICPDPCETPMFDERTFLSFRDRVNLLRCGYVSAVQTIKTEYKQLGAALARHGISLSLSKMDERLKMRMEQLSAGVPGNPQVPVERLQTPRPLVVTPQNVHG